MFKVNNRNARTRCEICSKLTIKTPEQTYFTPCSGVSNVKFKQVNPSCNVSNVSNVFVSPVFNKEFSPDELNNDLQKVNDWAFQ